MFTKDKGLKREKKNMWKESRKKRKKGDKTEKKQLSKENQNENSVVECITDFSASMKKTQNDIYNRTSLRLCVRVCA